MTTKVLRLGRFQTEALLGEGGTTETYRARLADSKPGADERRFVLTLLRSEHGRPDAQLAARFVEAARRLAGLDQSGFVRVVELCEGPGQIYAACEFKAGVDLAQLRSQAVPRGFMDARLVGLLAQKIAERLAPLHARTQAPRVHGGLIPGNVLVSPEGEVFLLDCGLAEAVRPRSDAFISRWFFAAPEQLSGTAATLASDLYSIGALMFFLFTGRPPFTAPTGDALKNKIAAGVPALPEMPPSLHAVMAKLLSSDAALRPKSAAVVARQISAAMLAAKAGPMAAATGVAASPVGAPGATPSDGVGGPVGQSPPDAGSHRGSTASQVAGARSPVAAPAPAKSARAADYPSSASAESVVPFALDEGGTGDRRPSAASRAGTAQQTAVEPVVPFSLEKASREDSSADDVDEEDDRGGGLARISADDPDVGVVYDDDDDVEEHVEVGADGKVRRRHRRRLRIPAWYRSPLARKMSRMALIPLAGLLIVAAVAGVLFYRQWAATRAASERQNALIMAEVARRAAELRPPKPPEPPALPAGQLAVKTTPAGATVWLDGAQNRKTPVTLITRPGSHRLVVTLPGYRMLRDVVDTSKGAAWEREMFVAPRLDSGRVPLTVTCNTEGTYPVFVDGRDSGEMCPASDLRIEPGRHSIGVFVIPQNRIWTFDREVQLNRPHRVQFNY
jgi:eukaryotic-like serine/threonine-protein kinase